MMNRLILSCILAVFLGITATANAQMYKWVGNDGRIFYSDRPPPDRNAETIEFSSKTSKASVTKTNIDNTVGQSTSLKKAALKEVVMYSASWCGVCKKAKAYFESEGIPFKEYDIETSRKGRKDYKELNGTGVPIIMVNNERMNGFSQGRFDEMYES